LEEGDRDALGVGEGVGAVSFSSAVVDFSRGLGVGVGLAKKCLIFSPSDSSSSLVPRA
jgi:hypothetical protein